MKIEPPTPLSTLIVTSIVYTLVAALQIMLGIFTQLSAFTYIFVLLIIALIYINDRIHKAEQLLRSITNQQAFNQASQEIQNAKDEITHKDFLKQHTAAKDHLSDC